MSPWTAGGTDDAVVFAQWWLTDTESSEYLLAETGFELHTLNSVRGESLIASADSVEVIVDLGNGRLDMIRYWDLDKAAPDVWVSESSLLREIGVAFSLGEFDPVAFATRAEQHLDDSITAAALSGFPLKIGRRFDSTSDYEATWREPVADEVVGFITKCDGAWLVSLALVRAA